MVAEVHERVDAVPGVEPVCLCRRKHRKLAVLKGDEVALRWSLSRSSYWLESRKHSQAV